MGFIDFIFDLSPSLSQKPEVGAPYPHYPRLPEFSTPHPHKECDQEERISLFWPPEALRLKKILKVTFPRTRPGNRDVLKSGYYYYYFKLLFYSFLSIIET